MASQKEAFHGLFHEIHFTFRGEVAIMKPTNIGKTPRAGLEKPFLLKDFMKRSI